MGARGEPDRRAHGTYLPDLAWPIERLHVDRPERDADPADAFEHAARLDRGLEATCEPGEDHETRAAELTQAEPDPRYASTT